MTCQSLDGTFSADEFTWFSVLRHFLEYDRNFHHHSLVSDLPCRCLSTPSMAMQALSKILQSWQCWWPFWPFLSYSFFLSEFLSSSLLDWLLFWFNYYINAVQCISWIENGSFWEQQKNKSLQQILHCRNRYKIPNFAQRNCQCDNFNFPYNSWRRCLLDAVDG